MRVIFTLLVLMIGSAWAQAPTLPQTPAPEAPDPIIQNMTVDFTASNRARDHEATALRALIDAYQKHKAESAKLAAEVAGWRIYAKPLYEQ